jgi:hypothetical protein
MCVIYISLTENWTYEIIYENVNCSSHLWMFPGNGIPLIEALTSFLLISDSVSRVAFHSKL